MAPKSDSAEGIVLNFVNETFELLLAELSMKVLHHGNFVLLARQDQFDIPNSEELNQMKEQNSKLQEQLAERKKAVSEVEAEIKALQSNLTLDQIQARQIQLENEVKQMEEKLSKLGHGVALVSPEERQAVEKMYTDMMNQWRRRKRMFRDVWSAITENSPKNLNEFKEELGLEYDEDLGVSLQSFDELGQNMNKRARRK